MDHPESASGSTARKRLLRRQFRERRRQQLPACEAALAHVLAGLLPALMPQGPAPVGATPRGGHWLGLYWPLPGEPDLRPVLQAAEACRSRLALPAIEAGRLCYRPWRPGAALEPDGCGIPAPPPAAGDLAAADLHLLLVPALAVDRSGIRLGYGGGWYDRLRGDPLWRRVEALAVLPQACIVEQLPREAWDIPLDGWISEAGLTRLCREP
jgi:5-formyltetrahydrofolate cyclo-ligase